MKDAVHFGPYASAEGRVAHITAEDFDDHDPVWLRPVVFSPAKTAIRLIVESPGHTVRLQIQVHGLGTGHRGCPVRLNPLPPLRYRLAAG